jgi:hypothetical protein
MRAVATTGWLPPGKTCAVCFSIDDIHPGRSTDAYEAGGDCEKGRLGLLQQLQSRQPDLHTTLFVTADWREISPLPTRSLLARIPRVRDYFYLSPILPRGTMSLVRHPKVVAYLRSLPRTELALHGLHHVHRGLSLPVEFQQQPTEECERILVEAQRIFVAAGISAATGLQPPAWNTPPALVEACSRLGLEYIAGARDIVTPVSPDAVTAMSGPRGMSLIFPEYFAGTRLIHLSSNWQATSRPERAVAILQAGGVLCIKAHIVKQWRSYVALDGLDDLYCNYLDLLCDRIRAEFGDTVWFTSMQEVARAVRAASPEGQRNA